MLTKTLQKKLHAWEKECLTRERFILENKKSNKIILDGKELINFCSNDYLGLSDHPLVKKSFIEGVERFGLGSGASAVVSGFHSPHRALEENFSEFMNRDQAILFNSGYLANLGVLSTLANRDCTVLSDKLCHASLLDGIQLSHAKHKRFRHNDISHVKELLQKNNLIVTESIFSMEGDISEYNE